jgi:hypothetical protein
MGNLGSWRGTALWVVEQHLNHLLDVHLIVGDIACHLNSHQKRRSSQRIESSLVKVVRVALSKDLFQNNLVRHQTQSQQHVG